MVFLKKLETFYSSEVEFCPTEILLPPINGLQPDLRLKKRISKIKRFMTKWNQGFQLFLHIEFIPYF